MITFQAFQHVFPGVRTGQALAAKPNISFPSWNWFWVKPRNVSEDAQMRNEKFIPGPCGWVHDFDWLFWSPVPLAFPSTFPRQHLETSSAAKFILTSLRPARTNYGRLVETKIFSEPALLGFSSYLYREDYIYPFQELRCKFPTLDERYNAKTSVECCLIPRAFARKA